MSSSERIWQLSKRTRVSLAPTRSSSSITQRCSSTSFQVPDRAFRNEILVSATTSPSKFPSYATTAPRRDRLTVLCRHRLRGAVRLRGLHLGQVGLDQVGPGQVGAGEGRAGEGALGEGGVPQVTAGQIRPARTAPPRSCRRPAAPRPSAGVWAVRFRVGIFGGRGSVGLGTSIESRRTVRESSSTKESAVSKRDRVGPSSPTTTCGCVEQDDHAAGVKAVAISMKRSLTEMGPRRTAKTLLRLNQAEGFDCPSCAWPDPEVGHRHAAEFCENGAKAVSEEATKDPGHAGVLRPAQHRRARCPDRALAGSAGPDHRADGQASRGQPLRADLLGRRLRHHRRPAERAWPTRTRRSSTPRDGPPTRRPSRTSCSSGRTARTTCRTAPTCATSRRRSRWPRRSASARPASAWRTCTRASLLVLAGQNPGTNHPRMLSALEEAKDRGAKIIAINPLREAGPGQLPQPAAAPRDRRQGHRPGRPAPAGQDQRRPRAVPGDRLAAGRVGRDRPRLRRHATRTGSRPGVITSWPSTGPRSRRPPG